MLLANVNNRIEYRGTKRLNAENIGTIRTVVESLVSLKQYSDRRKPERGKRSFPFSQLLCLWIYIEMNGLTYDADIPQDKLEAMGMPLGPDGYRQPSPARISGFIRHEWPEICPDIEREFIDAVLLSQQEKVFTVDSTPMEASRYSRKYAFNPHYEIRMAKAHIIMCNGIPLVATFTNANESDSNQLVHLLKMLPDTIRGTIRFASDGSYPSFGNYAQVYEKMDVVMASNPQNTCVFHEKVTWKYITRLYSSMWRLPDYKPGSSRRGILRFLIRRGRTEEVGEFLRNLDMRRGWVQRLCAQQRHVCETVHRAMKRWLQFDVRSLRRESEPQRMSMKFFAAQILCTIFDPYSIPGLS